jgi:hypothetical protein
MRIVSVAGLALLVVAAARPAYAGRAAIQSGGDLPADLVVDLTEGVLRTGTLEVSLRELLTVDPTPPDAECELRFAAASYDRAAGTLVLDEHGCTSTRLVVPKRRVIAVLARARAWAAEVRGDLAGARRQLSVARTADPGDERAARDLARVQLALGDAGAAMVAVRPFVAGAPIPHYADYLSSPVFAPLLDQPLLAGLRTTPPGNARVRGIERTLVAHSAVHDLFAVVREMPIGDGDWARGHRDMRDVELAILDRRGRRIAGFSLVPPSRLAEVWGYADLRDDADEVAARVAVANRFLHDLGFDPIAGVEIAQFSTTATFARVARFPVARLGVAEREGALRLLHGNKTLGEHRLYRCPADNFACDYPPTLVWAAWLPGLRVILVSWQSSGAEHSDRVGVTDVWRLPPAP